MDFNFMGGSMGTYVGQAIVEACDVAVEKGLTNAYYYSIRCARMQEGLLFINANG